MRVDLRPEQARLVQATIVSYAELVGNDKGFDWWEEVIALKHLFDVKGRPPEGMKKLKDAGCYDCADYKKTCAGADKEGCRYEKDSIN